MELTNADIALIRQSLKENMRQFLDVKMATEAEECRVLYEKFTEFRAERKQEIKVVRG